MIQPGMQWHPCACRAPFRAHLAHADVRAARNQRKRLRQRTPRQPTSTACAKRHTRQSGVHCCSSAEDADATAPDQPDPAKNALEGIIRRKYRQIMARYEAAGVRVTWCPRDRLLHSDSFSGRMHAIKAASGGSRRVDDMGMEAVETQLSTAVSVDRQGPDFRLTRLIATVREEEGRPTIIAEVSLPAPSRPHPLLICSARFKCELPLTSA